jgi:hypothetical protein
LTGAVLVLSGCTEGNSWREWEFGFLAIPAVDGTIESHPIADQNGFNLGQKVSGF